MMKDLSLRMWCSGANRIAEIRNEERGASAVEYALMGALIAAVIVAIVTVMGGKTSNTFRTVRVRLP